LQAQDREITAPPLAFIGDREFGSAPAHPREYVMSQRPEPGWEPRATKFAQTYQAFTVSFDGQFIGFENLICGSDAEATGKAQRLVDKHDVELWAGPRLVTTVRHLP
jgi:hypothetical protein